MRDLPVRVVKRIRRLPEQLPVFIVETGEHCRVRDVLVVHLRAREELPVIAARQPGLVDGRHLNLDRVHRSWIRLGNRYTDAPYFLGHCSLKPQAHTLVSWYVGVVMIQQNRRPFRGNRSAPVELYGAVCRCARKLNWGCIQFKALNICTFHKFL